MPENTPGERQQNAPNVICCVHIGRVEASNHRVESRLLFSRKRLVGHRDRSISEGIVIQWRIRVEVVGWRMVAINSVMTIAVAAEFRRAPPDPPSTPIIFRKS
jgi:hypothetical protein